MSADVFGGPISVGRGGGLGGRGRDGSATAPKSRTPITLIFDGGIAASGQLDLYDAAISMYGAARVFSILGHYYETGKIISQAPNSQTQVLITPPEQGSYRQTIIVTVVATTIAAPFGKFAERMFDIWFPAPNTQMEEKIRILEQENKMLRAKQGVPLEASVEEKRQEEEVKKHIDSHATECQVLRSIVSKSTKDMFRPVGRSADYLALTYGPQQKPISVLDVEGVARFQSEDIDDDEAVVVGVVNSFSRSAKSGAFFSRNMGRGVLFTYNVPARLPANDPFSWSQYTRKPLQMKGRFVRWFDGSIKKFLVHEVIALEHMPPEADELIGKIDLE